MKKTKVDIPLVMVSAYGQPLGGNVKDPRGPAYVSPIRSDRLMPPFSSTNPLNIASHPVNADKVMGNVRREFEELDVSLAGRVNFSTMTPVPDSVRGAPATEMDVLRGGLTTEIITRDLDWLNTLRTGSNGCWLGTPIWGLSTSTTSCEDVDDALSQLE